MGIGQPLEVLLVCSVCLVKALDCSLQVLDCNLSIVIRVGWSASSAKVCGISKSARGGLVSNLLVLLIYLPLDFEFTLLGPNKSLLVGHKGRVGASHLRHLRVNPIDEVENVSILLDLLCVRGLVETLLLCLLAEGIEPQDLLLELGVLALVLGCLTLRLGLLLLCQSLLLGRLSVKNTLSLLVILYGHLLKFEAKLRRLIDAIICGKNGIHLRLNSCRLVCGIIQEISLIRCKSPILY